MTEISGLKLKQTSTERENSELRDGTVHVQRLKIQSKIKQCFGFANKSALLWLFRILENLKLTKMKK
jgi:hypothetical protein